MAENLSSAAIIFDRDDTLLHDRGFMHRVEDLCWVEGAREAIRFAKMNGYAVYVATNQSGIARGYYTEVAMHAFHDAMQRDVNALGGQIDGFYHCPHHPQGTVPQYSVDCDCRKPKPGLLRQIEWEHGLDRGKSVMIGDKPRDVECARRFGVRGYLFQGGSMEAYLSNVLKEIRP